MTASQRQSRLLNRLATVPRVLGIRDEDAARVENHGEREDGFDSALRRLERRVSRLERDL